MGAAAAAGSAIVGTAGAGGFWLARRTAATDGFPAVGAITLAAAGAPPGYHADDRIGRRAQSGIWRSALAWQVTLFLGINSLVYYVIVGWLPAILQDMGYSEAQAGPAWPVNWRPPRRPGHPAGTPSPERSARHRRSGSLYCA